MLEIIPNLHPAVVHLPIALTVTALLFSLAARLMPQSRFVTQWTGVGHWTLWLAALTAIVAVAFGWQAYNSVNHDEAGHMAMTLHRNWALPTTFGLVLLAAWDAWRYRDNKVMSWPIVVILLVISLAVLKTAWFGGEVVYRHGIGVMALPKNEEVANPALPAHDANTATEESHDHGHAHHNHEH